MSSHKVRSIKNKLELYSRPVPFTWNNFDKDVAYLLACLSSSKARESEMLAELVELNKRVEAYNKALNPAPSAPKPEDRHDA